MRTKKKTAAPADAPAPITTNRVAHETPWRCLPAAGGCGTVHGLNFPGGACPGCGAFAVMRVVLVRPAGAPAGGAR